MIEWPSANVHSSTCGLIVLRRDARGAGQAGDVDLVVEVADVADDRLVLHPGHVGGGDDVLVAGRGDEDVGGLDDVVEGRDLVAVHRRLQRADRVDLGDDDAGALAAQRLGAALADVAVAEHDRDLAADEDVGGAVDAVDQRVAGAVLVVELRLGHRVVDVDRREQQRAGLRELVEPVDAGGGLLGDALDALRPSACTCVGSAASERAQQVEDDARTPRSRSRRCSARRRRPRTGCPCGSAASRRRRRRAACSGPCRPARSSICSVHHQYSGSVSPFQAKTGTPGGASTVPSRPTTTAAAAWSWVEKMLQETQRTSAPSATRVSIRTAVCTVMCSEPAMRAPSSGCCAPNSSRSAIRPGISCSARRISLRPNSASDEVGDLVVELRGQVAVMRVSLLGLGCVARRRRLGARAAMWAVAGRGRRRWRARGATRTAYDGALPGAAPQGHPISDAETSAPILAVAIARRSVERRWRRRPSAASAVSMSGSR